MARRASRATRRLVVVLLCGVASSCADRARSADEARPADGVVQSETIVDAAGVEHVFTEPARRIVSLVPSATATLHAIGADDSLVGRTDYDLQSWAAHLPSVGGGIEPNLEALVALRPDLVIRFEGDQDPRTPARLDELGIRHIAVRPMNLADIHLTTSLVGHAVGRTAQADSLTAVIRAGLAEVARAVAARPRVEVAYVLGGSPPWVAGPQTYIDEVLSLAGGNNVFPDLGAAYAAVSPEELRIRVIDVVLVAAAGEYDTSLTPGARIEVVGNALETPGPGVVSAAWHVAELMHGRSLR